MAAGDPLGVRSGSGAVSRDFRPKNSGLCAPREVHLMFGGAPMGMLSVYTPLLPEVLSGGFSLLGRTRFTGAFRRTHNSTFLSPAAHRCPAGPPRPSAP